ncbi:MAG: hypothetical protein LBR14_02270 [Clostridiales Family XIII bacterium]|jgi:hypothetical protein|nr:hypothetical protein [Clostridiales Family XIII bacterium]
MAFLLAILLTVFGCLPALTAYAGDESGEKPPDEEQTVAAIASPEESPVKETPDVDAASEATQQAGDSVEESQSSAATDTVSAAEKKEATTIGSTETPLAEPVVIEDQETPLSARAEDQYWALINLILMIVTMGMAAIVIITYFTRKPASFDEEYTKQNPGRVLILNGEVNRHGLFRVLTVLMAVGAIAMFAGREDMSLPMQMTDSKTIYHAILSSLAVLFTVLSRKNYGDREEQAPA